MGTVGPWGPSARSNLITHTTTRRGLRRRVAWDKGPYPEGIQAIDRIMSEPNITKDAFHVDWDYSIASIRQELDCLLFYTLLDNWTVINRCPATRGTSRKTSRQYSMTNRIPR